YGRPSLADEQTSDAPASDLLAEVDLRIEAAQAPDPKCFADFTFGSRREDSRGQRISVRQSKTNPDGTIHIEVGEKVATRKFPLQAVLKVSLLDLNGLAADKIFDIPVDESPRRWIGVRSRGIEPDRQGNPTLFEFVLLEGRKSAAGRVYVTIYREQNS